MSSRQVGRDDAGGDGPGGGPVGAGEGAGEGTSSTPLPRQAMPAGPGWTDLVLALVLAALTLFVYSGVTGHAFLRYDDDLYVTANAWVRRGLGLDGWIWSWTATAASNWHPLTWWSHMADVSLYGLAPAGHHATSVFLHVLNALLLGTFFFRTTGARWRSALVAALFAVHPLHVQSVAWVAERKDVLSTFWGLLALLAYHRYALRPNLWGHLFVGLCFALSLLAKPMLVTLPFLLLLLDRWPLGRSEPFSRLVREKLPLFALSLASSAITYVVQSGGGAVKAIPLDLRLGNAIASYVRYLARTFWPDGLAAFYPHPREVSVPLLVGGLLLLTGLGLFAWRSWKSRPWFPVGLFWYLGTLVPVIGIIQAGEQSMADRYTYLPMIGVTVVWAWGLAALVERRASVGSEGARPTAGLAGSAPRRASAASWGLGAVLAMIILLLAVRARQEVSYWRNDITLFTRALAVTGENHVAHGILAVASAEAGDLATALAHAEDAVRIRPDWPIGHKNRGKVLYLMGRPAEAEAAFREALRLVPSAVAHVDLASALVAQRKFAPAVAEYEQAVASDPDYAEAWASLAAVHTMNGALDLAFQCFERALAIDPRYVDAHVNYGIALQHVGRREEAKAAFRAALALDPDHALARTRLAALGGGS